MAVESQAEAGENGSNFISKAPREFSSADMVSQLLKLASAELLNVLTEVAKARPGILQEAVSRTALQPSVVTHVAVAAKVDEVKQPVSTTEDGLSSSSAREPNTADSLAAYAACQIIFSSHQTFAVEARSSANIEVMRTGNFDKTSSVHYHTQDGSAKVGIHYRAASGSVEFGPGSMYQTIVVEVINNADWDPTLDFYLVLEADTARNGEVPHLHTNCRVKIVDDDVFPTDKFQEKLLGEGPEAVPESLLMWEYIKMNWKNPVVRRGSIKILLTDLLNNIKFLYHLFLEIYLVNRVFMPVLAKNGEFSKRKQVDLVIAVLGFLIPDFFLHILTYRKNYWKVAGASKQLLQVNLMRTHMSYSAHVRSTVNFGEVMLILFGEIPYLVTEGYCGLFTLSRCVVQLIFILIFQYLALFVLGEGGGKGGGLGAILVNLGVFLSFPCTILPSLLIRDRKTSRLLALWRGAQEDAKDVILSIYEGFDLIKDYFKRGQAADMFGLKIRAANSHHANYHAAHTNNLFITQALTVTLVAAWSFCGGWLLMTTESLDLGIFLASLQILKTMGKSWTDIYEVLLGMQASCSALRSLTRLMNLPNEDAELCKFERSCLKMARELATNLQQEIEQSGSKEFAIDKLPIKLHNLYHSFNGNMVLSSINLTMAQGRLHAISTPRGYGKSLILRLCGRRDLLDSSGRNGFLFLPIHLKIRHVSREPIFFRDTLYCNLVYGLDEADEKHRRMDRVLAICTLLNIEEATLNKIMSNSAVLPWNEVLPRSTQHLLNIARGLIADAEVLIIHKPFIDLGPHTRPVVAACLRHFVDRRGLGKDPNFFNHRRPRTCVISVRPDENLHFVDEIHWPATKQSL